LVDVRLYAAKFDLDDAFLGDVAKAWPRLQYLALAGHDESEPPLATLSGPIPFARYCLELSKLVICVNACIIPDWKPDRRVSNKALIEPDVLCSPIVHSGWAAAFLSRIFPELSSIEARVGFEYWNMSSDVVIWKDVEALLPIFAAVRSEERELRTPPMAF
jgi:hypothetical protein